MLHTWEGIRKVHSASNGSLDKAKASQLVSSLGSYLSPDLLVELKTALIEGPIHLDGSIKEGEYRGSLVGRLSGYLWKNHGFSFHDKSNHLNDLYTKATREEVAFDLHGRFDPSFNWTPGDFGDGRSCFWLSHAIARYWMKEWDQAHAFCLYQKLEKDNPKVVERAYHKSPLREQDSIYTGYGRCWTFFNWPVEDCVVVFNAYPGDNLLNTFGQAILTGLEDQNTHLAGKLAMKQLRFKNTGSESNWFYTNSGHAVVIGTEKALKALGNEIDLKEKKPDEKKFKDYGGKCIFSCGRYAWKDRPSIFDIDEDLEHLGICEQCVYKKAGTIFLSCQICGDSTFYMKDFERYDVCAKSVSRKDGGGTILACPACHDTLDSNIYSSRYKPSGATSQSRRQLEERAAFDNAYNAEAMANIGG